MQSIVIDVFRRRLHGFPRSRKFEPCLIAAPGACSPLFLMYVGSIKSQLLFACVNSLITLAALFLGVLDKTFCLLSIMQNWTDILEGGATHFLSQEHIDAVLLASLLSVGKSGDSFYVFLVSIIWLNFGSLK